VQVSEDELNQWIADKYPHYFPDAKAASVATLAAHIRGGTDPVELRLITPYIKVCHGKFYHMTEIPGKPGQYEEASINYYDGIRVLNEIGYEGYINSEFEGQRSCQDRGREFMSDEVTEVRRHHEMMKRLIEETKRK
jgi:sugar phosphate isomerase/epimerase